MANEKNKKSSTKKDSNKNKTTKNTTASARAKNTKPVVKKEEKKEVKKEVKKTPVAKTPEKKTTIKQEENNYGRTILAAILIVVIFIGGYIAITINKEKEKNAITDDEIRFKEEYESINGTSRADGSTIKSVSIIENNNIEYIDMKKAAEILEDGSGIIYFGFAACPWCRNAVPVLLSAMQSSDLNKIYYVDLRPDDKIENDLRDIYELNQKNKPKKMKDAKEDSYYDVLTYLADELRDYKIFSDSGKEINTGEKRIYGPTVVAVANGEIVGFHEGTVEDHEKDSDGELRSLTKDEETELLNIYTKMISKYLKTGCDDKAGC